MVAAKQQSGRLGSGKVDRVVIIFKENHTFDNYFGTFPGVNGMNMPRSPNPPPRDPDHRHSAWLARQTNSVRQQFVEADIPAYFAYARKFTLCDQYFTDVAGPSTPNHLMVLAADSLFLFTTRIQVILLESPHRFPYFLTGATCLGETMADTRFSI